MMAMPNKTTVLVLLGVGLLCFAGLEGALRHHVGAPLLSLRDVRGTSVINILQTGGARYDAQLGWAQLPNFASSEFNTIDHGIRRNSPSVTTLPLGAILAVGDSYTAGSQVMDNETWPAQLEQRLGQPVLNAGVGGYGVDQIVLNAERLLPVVKPRAVIVGIHEDAIQRTTYKTFSTPKPYFIEEGGNWVLKNQPVPAPKASASEPLYKRMAARLVTAHLLFNRVAHDWWFSTGGQLFERTDSDPGREVCYLLDRLQDRLRAERIPGLVVVQYYGWSYWRSKPRDADTQEVLTCARRAGYAVVDEHDPMAAIAQRSIAELKQYYVMTADGTQFGHPSKLGNGLIASQIAAEFRNIKTASGVE
jgi:hypothetical protein